MATLARSDIAAGVHFTFHEFLEDDHCILMDTSTCQKAFATSTFHVTAVGETTVSESYVRVDTVHTHPLLEQLL